MDASFVPMEAEQQRGAGWGLGAADPPSPGGEAGALWEEKVALELSALLQSDRELLFLERHVAPFNHTSNQQMDAVFILESSAITGNF